MVFCELNPPADPPLLFYRAPIAPDLTLTEDDMPWDVVESVPLLWVTGTGVSAEPGPRTQREILEAPGAPRAHRARPGLPADVLVR